MPDDSSSRPGHDAGTRSRACGWVFAVASIIAVVSLLVILALLGYSPFLEAGFWLATGWIWFLARTLPAITWNGSLVFMGVLCSLLTILLGHFLAQSLSASRNRMRAGSSIPDRPQRQWYWRWRWSICGYFALWTVFLVGMSVVGIAHQLAWMSVSEEPMMESSLQRVIQIHRQTAVLNWLDIYHRTPPADRGAVQEVMREDNVFDYVSDQQSFHVFAIADAEVGYEGALIFPRVRSSLKQWTGLLRIGGDRKLIRSEKQLQEVLAEFRDRLRPPLADVRTLSEKSH